ncbi:MAG: hypothetical protein JRF50_15650 [Deltaproteobacteria bacterium]|nr:hypothetical protein [Deltaproteobacteria bacterium]
MAEKVQITTLVDNYIDIFIPSTGVASYPVPGKASQLWAEQGLSLWIEVSDKGRTKRILYDFGRSDQVLLHNAELLGLDFLIIMGVCCMCSKTAMNAVSSLSIQRHTGENGLSDKRMEPM